MKLLSCRSSVLVFAAAGAVVGFAGLAEAGDQQAQIISKGQSFCAAYGAGFVQVEGTRTCVRVSGHVRVEMEVGRPLRFEEATPLGTPHGEGLTAISSSPRGP